MTVATSTDANRIRYRTRASVSIRYPVSHRTDWDLIRLGILMVLSSLLLYLYLFQGSSAPSWLSTETYWWGSAALTICALAAGLSLAFTGLTFLGDREIVLIGWAAQTATGQWVFHQDIARFEVVMAGDDQEKVASIKAVLRDDSPDIIFAKGMPADLAVLASRSLESWRHDPKEFIRRSV